MEKNDCCTEGPGNLGPWESRVSTGASHRLVTQVIVEDGAGQWLVGGQGRAGGRKRSLEAAVL